MGQKSGPVKKPADQVVKEIRRATRRQFTAEEKIRIVLSGLRGEDSIAELCRREGIVQNLYYRWSKEFLEAGKKHPWRVGLTAFRGAERARNVILDEGTVLALVDAAYRESREFGLLIEVAAQTGARAGQLRQ